jgi:8-oxo-dGTP pyrophosphatase MutT (NUDIX family)
VIPGQPAPWKREGERVLASTRVLELRAVKFRRLSTGLEKEFTVAHAPDWVNVVAVTPDDQLVLVRQFRYGSDAYSLEVPGGVIEHGEDPLTAGLRELAEETGYGGGSARMLGKVRPNPAILDNWCHFALVAGAVPAGPMNWDLDEEIDVSTVPVAQALAWARSGEITHSLTIAALMFLEGTRARLT